MAQFRRYMNPSSQGYFELLVATVLVLLIILRRNPENKKYLYNKVRELSSSYCLRSSVIILISLKSPHMSNLLPPHLLTLLILLNLFFLSPYSLNLYFCSQNYYFSIKLKLIFLHALYVIFYLYKKEIF